MEGQNVRLTDLGRVMEFIQQLDNYSSLLSDSLKKLESSTNVLGATFRDENYSALRRRIQAMSVSLEEFSKTHQRYMPVIRNQLEQIRMYGHTTIDM